MEPLKARPAPTRRGRGTVLVVDDDPLIRQVLREQLEAAGFFAVAVDSGAAALALCDDLAPHVVVLDLYMPGLDGAQVCRAIKARADRPYVSVIMLSASDVKVDVLAGLDAGADDYLIKPTGAEELRARVSNLATVSEYHRLVTHQRDEARGRIDVLNEQLLRSERLATVGTLTSGILHELNNIAQVLTSALEELGEVPRPADKAFAFDAATSVSQHLRELSKSLLRAVRVDQEPDSCLFRQTVDEVLKMLALTGRTRGVEVRLEGADELGVRCGRVALQQVMLNLVGNAADALGRKTGSRIDLGAVAREGWLEVTVRDNGPGMTPEVLSKIFDPFFTTKPVGQGTGLGLPVVRRVIADWGGTLTVESSPGAGAAFVFTVRT